MTFRLEASFLSGYEGRKPPFGFTDMAGTSLGEVTFLRTYSRLKDDGTKETWQECCQRVIEGMYEIQRRHCERYTLPWSDSKAQESAQEAYDHLFNLRWSPAGRGLWAMGTPLVMSGNSAPLQSCAFASTEVMVGAKNPGRIFGWMMEASMLGVGVGFDDKAAESAMTVHLPGASQRNEGSQSEWTYVVPDTREGWAESIELQINSFMLPDQMAVRFDYSMIRPAGSAIRTFGGTASGPAPLRALHEKVDELLTRTAEAGGHLNEENICDIGNLIGVCVVSGNVRRSSEIFLGNPKSETFLNLKNFDHEIGKRRAGWSHLSNNSARASLDEDLEHLVPLILANGEPGVVWLENAQDYGRFVDGIDGKDALVAGTNPCQPAHATVLTPDGIRQLGDVGIGSVIWSEDGWVTITNKWSTGVKPVYEYATNAGSVLCTQNHRVVGRGVKMEAGDALEIDTLRGPHQSGSSETQSIDVLAGLVVGDGYWHRATKAYWLCIGRDDDYSSLPGDWFGVNHETATRIVKNLPDDLASVPLPERRVPERYLYGSPDVVRGFLRGLYSANGSIVGGARITLKATSLGMVRDVQSMLSSLGIQAYVTTNQPSTIEWPNGSYESRRSYDLNIATGQGRAAFKRLIGFIQPSKQERLARLSDDGRDPKVTFDITSASLAGEFEVFDITVDGPSHTYWSGGLNISNCSEQFLENYETCCLVETFPSNCMTLTEYLRVLKFAYLYAKTVTLLPTPWPETNAVVMRNRRIGTSASGIADFYDELGQYALTEWMDAGYEEVQDRDDSYSKWLGIRNSIKTTTVNMAA